MDADFDSDADVPSAVREHRRYRDCGDFSIAGSDGSTARGLRQSCLDIVVPSLANGPEVKKPLLENPVGAREPGCVGTSSFSFASMVQRLGPAGSAGRFFLALSYLASTACAWLRGRAWPRPRLRWKAHARVLAFEAGRKWGLRVNVISAGPWPRAQQPAIGSSNR